MGAKEKVIEARLLARDKEGKPIETIDEMYIRVAKGISDSPDHEAKVHGLLVGNKFHPNSPTYANAMRGMSLSGCFVLPVEDSMEGIFDAIKWGALVHKAGGGTGYSFTSLRPGGSMVSTTGREASGVLSFMSAFDAATETIKQGGVRRGANMALLRVDHLEIEAFIEAKKNDLTKLTNFNMSVGITDEFMRAVRSGKMFTLKHPKGVSKEVNARELFNKIIDAAWTTGEPGIVFLDQMNYWNPTPSIGEYAASNPCAEVPLLPFESCTLGSLVLSSFCTKDKAIDWDYLKEVIGIAVRALDNIVSVNTYILPQIEEATKATRKIGLGVMGFADLCIMMGIRYGSDKSIKLARQVMSFIQLNAFLASIDLAKEKGAFPAFEENKDRMLDILDRRMASWKRYWPKLVNDKIVSKMEKYGIRNATLITIAPTGTLSLIAECSSGIEPVFAFKMKHGGLDGTVGDIIHPLFASWEKANNVAGVPIPLYFVEAHQVPANEHLAIQAAFQEFTCNAISKTINLPKDASKETIEDIIFAAHKLDLKGLTVYRDGARTNILSKGGATGKEKVSGGSLKRGRRLTGETLRNELPCGKFYQVFNFTNDNIPVEVFFEMGKSGGCVKMLLEALGRTISVSLRSGVTAESIAKNLSGLSCDKTIWEEGKCFKSCMDIAAHNLIETMKLHGVKVEEVKDVVPGVPTCPECGTVMAIEEGCAKCGSCGYSDCGGK